MSTSRFAMVVLAGAMLSACDGQGQGGSTIDGGTALGGPALGGPAPVWTFGSTVSNLPASTFTVHKTPKAADLELLSSNLVPDLKSSVNYIEWLGEVRNNGSTPACFVEIRANFITAEGFGVQAMSSYAQGEPYQKASLGSIISCIPPGKTGAVWTNDLPPLRPDLSTIDIIEIELSLSPQDDIVPAPSAPSFANVDIVEDANKGAGFWSIAGAITAKETIYNIGVAAYPKDASGLLLMHATATHLDTLTAGESWDWQTLAYAGERPSSFLAHATYLLGTKP